MYSIHVLLVSHFNGRRLQTSDVICCRTNKNRRSIPTWALSFCFPFKCAVSFRTLHARSARALTASSFGDQQLDGQHGRETDGDEHEPEQPLLDRQPAAGGWLEHLEEHHVHQRAGGQPLEDHGQYDHGVRLVQVADQRADADARRRRDGEQQYGTVRQQWFSPVRQHLQPDVERDH